ncbi:hypothetical protein MMC13_003584 [Lambiella insularis]|nr:hypothetical protein [Lambiella insularis]
MRPSRTSTRPPTPSTTIDSRLPHLVPSIHDSSVDQQSLSSETDSTSPSAVSVTSSSTTNSTASRGRRRLHASAIKPRPSAPHPSHDSESVIPKAARLRSPANKRPPASRSSHGIETASGPPPALSTQRIFAIDNTWGVPLASDLSYKLPNSYFKGLGPPTFAGEKASAFAASGPQAGETGIVTGDYGTEYKEDKLGTNTAAGGMIASIAPPLKGQRLPLHEDPDRTLRAEEMDMYRDTVQQNSSREELQPQSSQEDLFLNLAQTDAPTSGTAYTGDRSERHRSRVGKGTHRSSLSQSTVHGPRSNARSYESGYEGVQSSPILSERRSSLQKEEPSSTFSSSIMSGQSNYGHRSYAASAHPLDQRQRSRKTGGASNVSHVPSHLESRREASPELPSIYGRRPSVLDAASRTPPRDYRQSNFSHGSNGYYHSSPLTSRPILYQQDSSLTPRAEGTESTVSTTAPSAIFDELDDLKSRLRKLELTAKLPASSSAAISTAIGERPRTATTTVTTMSPPPNYSRGLSESPGASVIGGPIDASIHPLLHSALKNIKPRMTPNTYQHLEATALDALKLAKMTGSGGPSSTAPDGVDRMLRRKVDSMCRSLTELCIAFSEERPETNMQRAQARTASRDVSLEPHEPGSGMEQPQQVSVANPKRRESSTSRALSRLEGRRSSVFERNSPTHGNLRNKDQQPEVPGSNSVLSTPKPERTSTVFQRRRQVIEDDNKRPVRPLSRANTETGRFLPPRRQSSNTREHLPQHTASSQDLRSPTGQSSLPIRRNYLSSGSHQPSSPGTEHPSRQYLERTTLHSTENPRLVEARQRRYTSFGQVNSAVREIADISRRRTRRESVEPAFDDDPSLD